MMNVNVFKAIADLALVATGRERAEYDGFLAFYKGLVEGLPTEAIKLFGNMSVKIRKGKDESTAGIELTAVDYIWWKESIASGVRFSSGVRAIKIAMLNHISKKAESNSLEPDERKKLIALLEDSE